MPLGSVHTINVSITKSQYPLYVAKQGMIKTDPAVFDIHPLSIFSYPATPGPADPLTRPRFPVHPIRRKGKALAHRFMEPNRWVITKHQQRDKRRQSERRERCYTGQATRQARKKGSQASTAYIKKLAGTKPGAPIKPVIIPKLVDFHPLSIVLRGYRKGHHS